MTRAPRPSFGVAGRLTLVVAAIALSPGAASAESVSFSAPGSDAFTVPGSVTGLKLSVTGAGGGEDPPSPCFPGKGGNLQATFPVTPGSQLAVTVAGRGSDTSTGTGAQGGFGGGGSGGTVGLMTELGGGGGGGASRVTSAGSPLLVGGGGGGCGGFSEGSTFGSGGDNGEAGEGEDAVGGGPGSQSSGGTGGASANAADPGGANGSAGQGGAGAGADAQNGGGGGGGGGLFGGGGGGGVRVGEGVAGGGGGGSDFIAAGGSSATTNPGSNAGNGQVTISFFTLTQPTVTGTTEVGRTLTAQPGTATGGGSPGFQWSRSSGNAFAPIPGATGTTYRLGRADRGRRVAVTETVSDANGSAAATSTSTQVIGPPLLTSRVSRTQRVLRQRGVLIRLRSNLAGVLTVTGTVGLPSGVAKSVRFRRVRRTLRAGRSTLVRVRLSRRSLASIRRGLAVRRRLRARLTITVGDQLGGRTTRRVSVRLRR